MQFRMRAAPTTRAALTIKTATTITITTITTQIKLSELESPTVHENICR